MNDDNMKKEPGEKSKEEQYNLYTEQIVKSPWKKIKRIVKYVAKVVGSAVLFGAVAGLVIALLYPNIRKFAGEEETTSRQGVSIPTDSQTYEESDNESSKEPEGTQGGDEPNTSEYQKETETSGPTEQESETGETQMPPEESIQDTGLSEKAVSEVQSQIEKAFESYNPGVGEFDSMYEDFRRVIGTVNRSIVAVLVSENGEYTDYLSGEKVFGFIAAENEEYFFILTLKEYVENHTVMVSFNDGTITGAEYLAGDTTTNCAVLAVLKSAFETVDSEKVRAAVLGNSYIVQQGDPLLIMGNVYEQPDMAVYSMASATRSVLMDTDSSYRLICTSETASPSDCGIIANTAGDIVGLILHNNERASDRMITAYGISELKSLIERLINGKVTPYAGILPQNVSLDMQNMRGMPKGVYVNSIEPDSPAYYAVIQSGDIITAADGSEVDDIKELQKIMFAKEPGSILLLNISRPGRDGYREIQISLELGAE